MQTNCFAAYFFAQLSVPYTAINVSQVGMGKPKRQTLDGGRPPTDKQLDKYSVSQAQSPETTGPWMTWHIFDYGLHNSSGYPSDSSQKK